MPSDIASLEVSFPLWSPWRRTEVVDDEVRLGDHTVSRAGVAAATPDGLEVCGSAAETRRSPLDRCWFELLERAATLEAARNPQRTFALRDEALAVSSEISGAELFPASPTPQLWRYALSNGTAVHRTREEACRRATLELVERDAALRAWRGDTLPEHVPLPEWANHLLPAEGYEWMAFRLPVAMKGVVTGGRAEVAMVIGFPLRPTQCLARGCGASSHLHGALRRACMEVLQGLAFLCEEPIPDQEPTLVPSPTYHLDRYLWPGAHEALRRWLAGGHHRAPRQTRPRGAELRFVDLTPEPLQGELWVIKAVHDGALPLTFGATPAHVSGGFGPHPFP